MAERRSLDEERLRQCYLFFQREVAHWDRLTGKRVIISTEEFEAKKEIIEAVHRVAAVAAVECGQQEVQTLQWNFRELSMAMESYKRIMDV